MENKNVHPFWIFWLMISTIPMGIGGVTISNKIFNSNFYIPEILVIIQMIFILYLFMPRKKRREESSQ